MQNTELSQAIKLIQEVDENCRLFKYSLDDVATLQKIIEVLQEQKRLIYQCCS